MPTADHQLITLASHIVWSHNDEQWSSSDLHTLRPRQKGRHFTDDNNLWEYS